jgi:hypothetical protein
MTRGVAFFDESVGFGKNILAKEFEDGAPGAMSNIKTKNRYSTGLFFYNEGFRTNNFVKFDGWQIKGDVLEMIDRKWNVTTKSKQIRDLQRMSKALQQNPMFGSLKIEGIIEVPGSNEVRAAVRALDNANVRNIKVRIAMFISCLKF